MKPSAARSVSAMALAAALALSPVAGAWAQTPRAVVVGGGRGEPLPAGAPSEPYELAAWCYGAMGEYLALYDKVKPEIRAIDRAYGPPGAAEAEPYHSDVAAARTELKVLSGAVEAAEKASPQVISDRGASALKGGRMIWAPVEQGTKREQARAWLTWALPDRCDSNARELATRSALLGQVLKYNVPSATDAAATGVQDSGARDSGAQGPGAPVADTSSAPGGAPAAADKPPAAPADQIADKPAEPAAPAPTAPAGPTSGEAAGRP